MRPNTTPLIVGKFKDCKSLLDIDTFSFTIGGKNSDDYLKATTRQDYISNMYNKAECTLKLSHVALNSEAFKHLRKSLDSSEPLQLKVATYIDDMSKIKMYDTCVDSMTFQRNGIFQDAIINCMAPSIKVLDILPNLTPTIEGKSSDYLYTIQIEDVDSEDVDDILDYLEEYLQSSSPTNSSKTVQITGIISMGSNYSLDDFINELYLLVKGRSNFRVQLTGLDDKYTLDTTYFADELREKESLRSLILKRMGEKVYG